MRKMRAAGIVALMIAALGSFLWFRSSLSRREPVYQGKTLTYWLRDIYSGRNPTAEKWQQDKLAVRQIGTNAIPLLLQWISAKDDPLKQCMVTWIYNHRRTPFRLESSVDKNIMAIIGFQTLEKSQAGSAIPALVEMVKKGGGARSGPNNVSFAMQALACLDRQAATNGGIKFGTNGAIIGWSAPPVMTNK
jgi:hypothetical protein